MLFLEKKWFKAKVLIRWQVRALARLNRDSLSRLWITMKRTSFGRSDNVASANEGLDSSFEVPVLAGNSKVAAILVVFRFIGLQKG